MVLIFLLTILSLGNINGQIQDTCSEEFYYEPLEHKLDNFCVCENKSTDSLLIMKSYIEENMVLETNLFKKAMYQFCLLNIKYVISISENRNKSWEQMKMKMQIPLKEPEEE